MVKGDVHPNLIMVLRVSVSHVPSVIMITLLIPQHPVSIIHSRGDLGKITI